MMIGCIYILYVILLIIMITYFSIVYKISPWRTFSYNKKFRYRIRKFTDTYDLKTDRYYIIYRKYNILTPWFQVSKKINTADEVSKMLSVYMNNDKEKSCVKKKQWLNDEEFLAEVL